MPDYNIDNVVNCFKKCIFAVIQTTKKWQRISQRSCELLQKVYLCSNTNNIITPQYSIYTVVNCFKKCIFAVIQTTSLALVFLLQ